MPDDGWKRMLPPLLNSKDDIELVNKCQFFMEIDTIKLGKYATETRASEIGCTTLVHGDIWANNIMVKFNDDGSISDEVLSIIDWQTTFEGNPLFDVACFVTNCVDAEIRREFERDIVDFYFDYLTNNYADQGEKLKFTREEAHELYDIALIQQSFICMARYALFAIPLTQSENSEDRAKAKKLAHRLHQLYDDALLAMDKYGLKDKFKL